MEEIAELKSKFVKSEEIRPAVVNAQNHDRGTSYYRRGNRPSSIKVLMCGAGNIGSHAYITVLSDGRVMASSQSVYVIGNVEFDMN